MGTRDARVDAYIRKSAAFARPILTHLREVVHDACPEVRETIKWKMPSFEYKGLLCGVAAFKAHCAFGFWKHHLVVGEYDAKAREAMGSFGRLTSLADLPAKTLLKRYVKTAMRLNENGVKPARAKRGPRKPIPMHADFKKALAGSRKAAAAFDAEGLRALISKTGLTPRELLRTGEAVYKELGLGARDLADDEIIRLMVAHPELIQRPVVVRGDRAVLARPAEKIREVMGDE